MQSAGIISAIALLLADAGKVGADSGIAVGKIRKFQAASRKKKDNAIIQLERRTLYFFIASSIATRRSLSSKGLIINPSGFVSFARSRVAPSEWEVT
jgi:hypothetical protein